MKCEDFAAPGVVTYVKQENSKLVRKISVYQMILR